MMNMGIDLQDSNDQTIVKGKRTKRPSSSSSSSFSTSNSSLTTSSSTQEDEDMANCLILLARGGRQEETPPQNKFRSRKFTEMNTTPTNEKEEEEEDVVVYECRTCSRTFASFQALGGHRASHKKPKADHQRKSPPPTDAEEEEVDGKLNASTLVLQSPEIKSKIHECAICGSEFASGQALGGHMRRHRSAIKSSSHVGDHKSRRRNMLALDLNLPAPPEEDEFSYNHQPRLVFSATIELGGTLTFDQCE